MKNTRSGSAKIQTPERFPKAKFLIRIQALRTDFLLGSLLLKWMNRDNRLRPVNLQYCKSVEFLAHKTLSAIPTTSDNLLVFLADLVRGSVLMSEISLHSWCWG